MPASKPLVAHHFTFGSDHRLPSGAPAGNEFVQVFAPADRPWLHRTLFIEWLGSNAFSTEYDADEWPSIYLRYFVGQSPAAILTFTIAESA